MQENKSKSTRGLHFEKRVMNRPQSHFDSDRVFYNLTMPGRKKNETQIDFVLLDRTGICIIEAKDYSGTVTGSFDDIWWTKALTSRDGRTWTSMPKNPVFQNRGHIKAMKKLLKDDTIPVFSVTVISDKCDLSQITGSHRGEYIFTIKDFSSKLEELISIKRKVLSESRVEEVKEILIPQINYNNLSTECRSEMRASFQSTI